MLADLLTPSLLLSLQTAALALLLVVLTGVAVCLFLPAEDQPQ